MSNLFNKEETELLEYFLQKKYGLNIEKNKNWTTAQHFNFTIEDNNFKVYIEHLNLFLNFLLENKILILNINLYLNKIINIDLNEIINILNNYYNTIPKLFLQNFHPKLKLILDYQSINFNQEIKQIFSGEINYDIYFNSIKIDDLQFETILTYLKNKNFNLYFCVDPIDANLLNSFLDNKIIQLSNNNISLLSLKIIENKKQEWNDLQSIYFLNFLEYYFDKILFYLKDNFNKNLLDFNFQYASFFNKKRNLSELNINLQDLSIIVDKELFASQFKAGYLQNNNIIAMPGLSLFLQLNLLDNILLPKCSECVFNKICEKNQFNIQYEITGELLLPIQSICELEKKKILKLIEICKKYDLIKYIQNLDILSFINKHNLI